MRQYLKELELIINRINFNQCLLQYRHHLHSSLLIHLNQQARYHNRAYLYKFFRKRYMERSDLNVQLHHKLHHIDIKSMSLTITS